MMFRNWRQCSMQSWWSGPPHPQQRTPVLREIPGLPRCASNARCQTYRAGETLYIDFAGPTVELSDGSRAHIFVAALGASNCTTTRNAMADRLTGCAWALTFFVWVPHLIVPDNSKAMIANPTGTLADFARQYNTFVLLARLCRPGISRCLGRCAFTSTTTSRSMVTAAVCHRPWSARCWRPASRPMRWSCCTVARAWPLIPAALARTASPPWSNTCPQEGLGTLFG